MAMESINSISLLMHVLNLVLVLGVLAVLVLAIVALELKAAKNYKRRTAEQPVVTVSEGEGAAE